MALSELMQGVRAGFHAAPVAVDYELELAEFREVVTGLLAEKKVSDSAIAERDRLLAQTDCDIRTLAAERDEALRQRHMCSIELAQARATCDRYLAVGKRNAAQRLELEAVLKFPGVKLALRKLIHPDAHAGASADKLRLCNETFAKLTAIYQRLEGS